MFLSLCSLKSSNKEKRGKVVDFYHGLSRYQLLPCPGGGGGGGFSSGPL